MNKLCLSLGSLNVRMRKIYQTRKSFILLNRFDITKRLRNFVYDVEHFQFNKDMNKYLERSNLRPVYIVSCA